MIGGNEALFEIPFESNSNKWIGNQFHYALGITQFVDGNYNLILELFDNDGNKIKPNNSIGVGEEKDFHFLKWTDDTDTDVVNYSTLIHNIRINNKSCFASIEDLRNDTTPNQLDCQFMVGNVDSKFTKGFRAYHVDGFLRSYSLDYRKGLNGDDVVFKKEEVVPIVLILMIVLSQKYPVTC